MSSVGRTKNIKGASRESVGSAEPSSRSTGTVAGDDPRRHRTERRGGRRQAGRGPAGRRRQGQEFVRRGL